MYPTAATNTSAKAKATWRRPYENSDVGRRPRREPPARLSVPPNLTPIGYSARVVPTSGTGSGSINSDLAFQGNYAYQGTYTGFRILDISNPADPIRS